MTEKQIMKLMKIPLTDQGNAERLRFIFGNKWKYLPRYRLWLHWNGHRWEGRRTVNLVWTAGDMFHELILAICAMVLAIYQHRANIKRLRDGTEADFKAAKDK